MAVLAETIGDVRVALARARSGLAGATGGSVDLPGGKTAVIVGELHVNSCQLGRHARTADRGLTTEFLLLFRRCAAAHLQRGPDRSWGHAIDPDALRGQLLGKRLDEIHGRRL